MKHKEIYRRACTGDNRSVLILLNKRTLLVIVKFWANILPIFIPNGVSPSYNTRSKVQCLLLVKDINQI